MHTVELYRKVRLACRDSIQTAAARITGSIGGNLLGDHDAGFPLVED